MSTTKLIASWKKGALLLCLGVGIVVLTLFGTNQPDLASAVPDENNNGGVTLQIPSFVNVANAEELDVFGISSVIEDAGFTAYYQHPSGIDLNHVRNLYQVVEDKTDEYIIGYFGGDIRVYINTDGWIMAYHFAGQPTAKIFDHDVYESTWQISTTLERTVEGIADKVGALFSDVKHYHFQHPNATNLIFIVEYEDQPTTATFYRVTIPNALIISEFSASVKRVHESFFTAPFKINGSTVVDASQAIINPDHLPLGQEHDISVVNSSSALVILYSEE